MSPYICSQLIFEKHTEINPEKKYLSTCKDVFNRIPASHFIKKKKSTLKWIEHQLFYQTPWNYRRNHQEHYANHSCRQTSYKRCPKHRPLKQKINNLNCIKLKCFCTTKKTINKVKTHPKERATQIEVEYPGLTTSETGQQNKQSNQEMDTASFKTWNSNG